MAYRFLADVVLILHLAFALFAVLGALLVFRWPRLAWFHVPAAAWGTIVELAGWYCPLTPVENDLRRLGGEQGYAGGFIDRYVVSILYPGELSRAAQITLGVLAMAINLAIYAFILRRRNQRSHEKRIV